MPRKPARATVFHAIADPTRRALVLALARWERTAGALAGPFGMSQPAVSQHLKVLRDAGLVRHRRVGRHLLYRLEPAPLREVREWVRRFEPFTDP